MTADQRPIDYWKSGEGLAHITPPGNEDPESETWTTLIQTLLFGQDFVEFGCGRGRLAPMFSKNRYRGVDICPKAIEIARRDRHGYNFAVIDETELVHAGFSLFAHNVMMHIPDDDLTATIRRFDQRQIIVSEILGKNHRRAGNPPVFNRDIRDYDEAFVLCGYALERVVFVPTPKYGNGELDTAVLQFHKAK